MNDVNKNLGHATAYGYAKSKGYTGTEEEFAELMADYAAVGQRAEAAATAAAASATAASGSASDSAASATAAEGFAGNASTSAGDASQAAQNASQSATAASGSATSAAGSATAAAGSATTAGNKATEAAGSATAAAGSATTAGASATAAQAAQTAAETAQTAAETAQGAAEDAAESVEGKAAQIDENTQEISLLKSQLEVLYGQPSENILDVSSLTDGYIKSDGTIDTTDHAARVTDFLPVKGTTLTCCIFNEAGFKTETKPIRAVGYYNLNKGFISRDTSNASTFTVPSNAAYVRLSFVVASLYEYEMVAWSSAKLDKWVAYRGKPESYYSPLYGKSIACFGDSICKGENWISTPVVYPNSNTGWAKLLKEKYNAQVYGYGISGATIRKIQDNTNSVYEQFAQFVYYATANGYVPDIILLEGGINDATRYYNGTDTDADFGAFVDGYGQSNYYTETIGALERMFYTAKTTFPETKIIYILPHHCSGEGFQTALQKYINAIKQACDKWSIPYIDLYTKGRLNGCITALRATYFDEYGVHPNQAGYEIMTEDIEKGILDV